MRDATREDADAFDRTPRRCGARPGRRVRGNGHSTAEFVERWRNAAYNCYSSGHKFCREVCPVMQVTRDEVHSPTAFHANVVAMEQGLLSIEDVARDYVHCTQCGACELRCPNTLFTGDFYRFVRGRFSSCERCARSPSTRASTNRTGSAGWRRPPGRGPSRCSEVPVSQENVRDWADGLDIPEGGETILFCDCEGRSTEPRCRGQPLAFSRSRGSSSG